MDGWESRDWNKRIKRGEGRKYEFKSRMSNLMKTCLSKLKVKGRLKM